MGCFFLLPPLCCHRFGYALDPSLLPLLTSSQERPAAVATFIPWPVLSPKALGKKPETSGSVLLEGFTPQAVSLNVTPAPDPGTVLSLLHVRVIAPGSRAVGMLPRHLTGNSLFNVILHFLSQPTRVSTVWIREHWAELSEDRREAAGLSAEGSCADPKPSGLHRGATRPSRWRVSRKAQMMQLR